MNVAAYLIAAAIFVLAGFGVTVGELGELDALALGLAVFAVAHVLPR